MYMKTNDPHEDALAAMRAEDGGIVCDECGRVIEGKYYRVYSSVICPCCMEKFADEA
jgi:hypothetical protein